MYALLASTYAASSARETPRAHISIAEDQGKRAFLQLTEYLRIISGGR